MKQNETKRRRIMIVCSSRTTQSLSDGHAGLHSNHASTLLYNATQVKMSRRRGPLRDRHRRYIPASQSRDGQAYPGAVNKQNRWTTAVGAAELSRAEQSM